MKALDALLNRSSSPKLCDPLPPPAVLENIYKSALRAADHAVLRPWRFLVIKGVSRERLGDLFVTAATLQDPAITAEKQLSLRQKPLRAPMILITISNPVPHPKVPEFEQDLSAAAAMQNMLLAAYAQGVGAMWRTGAMAYDQTVMRGLGLAAHEKIIGFLYLGTVGGAAKNLNDPPVDTFFKEWHP